MKKYFFGKKEQPDFYSMLKEQCRITLESIELFLEFVVKKDFKLTGEIELNEKRADRVRQRLIEYVEKSFITPLDRHDIFGISRVIDDITDRIKDLKDFIIFFSYEPSHNDIQIINLLAESITYLYHSMSEWENDDVEIFWENLVKAKKNENQVKRIYWQNIIELRKSDGHFGDIIIRREFSRDLNSLANKIGRTADRIGEVKIKSIK